MNNEALEDNQNYVTHLLRDELEMHLLIISRYQDELKELPVGALCRKVINGKPYFYHQYKSSVVGETGIQKCLNEKDSELKNKLVRKQFLRKALSLLKKNVKAIYTFQKNYGPFFPKEIRENLTVDYPQALEVVVEKSDFIKRWQNEEFEKGKFYSDGKIHTTFAGLEVRSKSEALIAGCLEMNNIPFRYESKLVLAGQEYYPDFTILKPKDGKIIYWEHYGMMRNEKYKHGAEQKHKMYISQGLIPWKSYIATYDDENGSIDASTIQNIIKAFILS